MNIIITTIIGVFGLLYFVQVFIIFLFFYKEFFIYKKDFLKNLIPYYYVHVRIRDFVKEINKKWNKLK